MTVVEFCGNPGCGKSTLAREFILNMQGRGLRVADYNEIKPSGRMEKLKAVCAPQMLGTAGKFFHFGRHTKVKKRLIYSIKCATILRQLEQWREEDRADFVVFDEGIVQYLSTLCHGTRLGEADCRQLEFLKDFYRSEACCVLDCRLDMAENVRRIRARAKSGDRFVSDRDEEQEQLLMLKRENLTALLQYLVPQRLATVEMSGSPKENLDALLRVEGLRLS